MKFPWPPLAVLFIGLVGCGGAAVSQESLLTPPSRTPLEVATEYLDAMESGDLDGAEALFASHSSVFESGGVEGTWQHYREHHIGPELVEIETFTIKRDEPETQSSQDGSMAFVAWPIEYRIRLHDERTIESRGTVTFVMALEAHRNTCQFPCLCENSRPWPMQLGALHICGRPLRRGLIGKVREGFEVRDKVIRENDCSFAALAGFEGPCVDRVINLGTRPSASGRGLIDGICEFVHNFSPV